MYWIGQIALQSNRQLAVQREVIEHLERTASSFSDAETGQRGYLLTGETSYLEPYHQALVSSRTELGHLSRLAAAHELRESQLREVQRLAAQKLAELDETVSLRREGRADAALAIVRSNRGKDLMAKLRFLLEEMETQELAEFHTANRRAEQATFERNLTFLATGLINLGFFAWAYRLTSREVQAREAAQEGLRRSHAELEERVAERTADLAAANRELEAFGYSVSHDLRAPLRHISSFIRLLEKGSGPKLDETGRRHIEVIAEAAQRMGHLIDDLLVLSRIGRTPLSEQEVNLAQLVEDARRELAPDMAGRAIEWQVNPLPAVRGDPSLLRSAMVNLLSNAIKYTRRRNPAHIEVGSRQQNAEVVCYVRDNGAGFDMQFVDKLFGVFQRLHDRGEFEGTGIGLASVRRIVQRHGGKTWGEGAVDRGATFYFSLPKERLA